jgi:hypothetical protein
VGQLSGRDVRRRNDREVVFESGGSVRVVWTDAQSRGRRCDVLLLHADAKDAVRHAAIPCEQPRQEERASPDALIDYLADGGDTLGFARRLLRRALAEGGRAHPNSVVNCHLPGLDSVVLYAGPDGMIRFYFARAGANEMHRLHGPDGHFTLGVHNHRYRIAKIPLNAPIINMRTRPAETAEPWSYRLYAYRFRSALRGEEMGVEPVAQVAMEPLQPDLLVPGQPSIMQPEDQHTVMVSPGIDTAWLVVEGAPQEITPLIYSPRPDLAISGDGLYTPMTDLQQRASLEKVLSLMGAA